MGMTAQPISRWQLRENEMLETEISDELLEAAAFAGNLRAYTQFDYCTQVACPLTAT